MHFSIILQDFETKISGLESKVNTNKGNADIKISSLESKVNTNKGNADSKIGSLESTVKSNKAKADTKISDLDKKVNSNKNDANSKISSLTTQHRGKIDALWKQVENPVIFTVRRSNSNVNQGSYITFNEWYYYGGGWNPDPKTGIFKAPRNGFYSFSFSSMTTKSTQRTEIDVYHKGNVFTRIASVMKDKEHSNIAASWMMRLKTNDEVKLKMRSNGLQTSSVEKVIWNGELRRAE